MAGYSATAGTVSGALQRMLAQAFPGAPNELGELLSLLNRLTLTSAELDTLVGSTPAKGMIRAASTGLWTQSHVTMLSYVPLAGVVATTGGAIASWAPNANVPLPVIIGRTWLYTSVKSTGAANVSVGVAADAVTSSANLIDTLAVGGAALLADNITDKGTLGKSRQLLSTGQFVTVTGSADTSGLVGMLVVEHYLTA